MAGIQLIIGLGNPGPNYAKTRHNAGAWLLQAWAEAQNCPLRAEKKFHGLCAKASTPQPHHLLMPTTFMNESGLAIKAFSQFLKIPSDAILVAHDDLDLPAGQVRLKFDGGHGGHNGLRNTIQQLGTRAFYRLRIGIDHPGHRDKVHDYVLSPPNRADKTEIDQSIATAIAVMDWILAGQFAKVMQYLHTDPAL